MIRWLMILAGLAWLGTNAAIGATPTGLTADLTERLVQITTGFSGVHVTLFGAIEGDGDIVVTVRGPDRDVTIREKRDVAGIWLNRHSVRFDLVPAYYAVLSTKPLSDILSPAKLSENGIGIDAILLKPEAEIPPEERGEFRQALISSLGDAGLYRPPSSSVALLDGHLFESAINLPETVPIGNYAIRVFLVRRGAIIASQTLPLVVAETGFEAATRAVARGDPLLYGLLAIFAAAVIGWLGDIVLRSGR